MGQNRKLKVFLCHSKDDKPKVRELYRRLVADGFDAWLDEEKLMPGHDWDLEIRKAVRESDAVVVCLSNSSVTKAGYVQKEIRFALDVADEQPEGAIFIIPARLEDCQVPTRLNRWQWVNLFETKGLEKLKSSLIIRANSLGANIPIFVEPLMVKIPAGKFLMGSTQEQAAQVIIEGENKDLIMRELPQHIVELSEYSIGKYPITNREYQAFVRDAKYTPPRGRVRDQFPTEKSAHPVVNVSWNDAIAYCKWLSEKTDKHYRLPTEAEWEKAARGESGLIYPWGNEFNPKNANTVEARIKDTTEVGQFSPQGNSPYGCMDMAGNVWEWTSTLWGINWRDSDFKYPYNAKDGRENTSAAQDIPRVLRGGSFYDFQSFARCAFRYKRNPDNFVVNYGFRIVLAAS